MGVTVSSSHVISAAPSSSGAEDSSLPVPAPAWGPSHRRQFSTNFSNMSPSHRLQLFTKCPSVGPAHQVQEQAAPAWVPTGSQVLPANLLQRELLSPQVRRSWQEPAAARAPHRVTASFRHPPALAWGPFHGLQMDICSTMDLHGLHGDNLPHHGLHHELQGKTLCSGILRAPPPPPSSLTLVSAELFLSCILTPLLGCSCHCEGGGGRSLLKYVITEALPPLLMALALSSGGSLLEPAGIGSVRHRGSFQQLLTEATPVAPPTRTLPRRPNTST